MAVAAVTAFLSRETRWSIYFGVSALERHRLVLQLWPWRRLDWPKR
jgi:hypothetical protein